MQITFNLREGIFLFKARVIFFRFREPLIQTRLLNISRTKKDTVRRMDRMNQRFPNNPVAGNCQCAVTGLKK